MTLDEARGAIDREVLYLPPGGSIDSTEVGVITSVNHRYVFVRFGSGATSAACNPADLTLLSPEQAQRREWRASLRNEGLIGLGQSVSAGHRPETPPSLAAGYLP